MKKIIKNSLLACGLLLVNVTANVQAQTIIPNKLKGCAPELGITFDIVPAPAGNNVIDFGDGVLVSLSSYTGISTSYLTPGSQLVQVFTNVGTIANPVAGTFIDSVRLLISKKPDVSFTATKTNGCAPLLTSFTKTVTTYGSPVANTTWIFGDGDASNSTATTLSHSYLVNCPLGATYIPSLTVVDQNGCQTTFQLSLPVSVSCKPKIVLSPAAPFSSCTSPKSYLFDASASTSGSPNGANSPLIIDWKTKTGISGTPPKIKLNSDTVNQTYTTGSYGNYAIVTDDNGCTDSLYFGVSIGNPVINKFNIPDTICANTPINFYDSIKVFNSNNWIMSMGNGQFFAPSPGNKIYSYDDTCGVFRIKFTARNGNGCQDTISKNIVVQRIKLSFETNYICEMARITPTTIKIKNTTQFCGGVDATYKWEIFDTNYVREVAITHPWYKLNDKINVANVHYPWHVVGASTGPGPVAPGSTPNTPFVTTTNNTVDSAAFQLQWLDTNQYATNNYMGYQHATQFGRVRLTAISNNGCVAELVKPLNTTIDLVESFFTMSDHYGCAPLTITFKDSSISSTGAANGTGVGATPKYPLNEWSWNFDDGTALDPTQNPVHTFATPGIYNVHLAVKNTNGCRDTSYAIQVQVGDKPVPNFTVTPPSCHDAVVSFTDGTTFSVSDPNNTSYSYYASSPNLVQGFGSPTYANGPFNANNQAMSSCFTSPLSSYTFENIAGPVTIGMKVCVRGCCDQTTQTINIAGPLVRLRAALLNQTDSTFKCSSTYVKTNLDSTTYSFGDYTTMKFSAHVQDGDQISMDWEGNGTFDSTFTINSSVNHFFQYNHHYATTGTFKAIIKVENTLNGCPPSYDTVVVYPNKVFLNGHLKNAMDTVMCQTDPGKANAVPFIAHTTGVNWESLNALSWDWDEERFNTIDDQGNPVVLTDLSQAPTISNNKADTIASHGFVNWDKHYVVVTIRDINNCVLRDTITLKINGIAPKIVLGDRGFVNGQQYMCQFDTMHFVNQSTSSSNITDWYWGIYEKKPIVPQPQNPPFFTWTGPGAPPVYYPNPAPYLSANYYQYNLTTTPPPPLFPQFVTTTWGQHIGNPVDGDLRKDTSIALIKDSWPRQYPLVMIYQMKNADGCVKTVNDFQWEQIQNAPELGPQPFTTRTFCLSDTLGYKITLIGSAAEQAAVKAKVNDYKFKWIWGDGTGAISNPGSMSYDTTHTFDTIKHEYHWVQQPKQAYDNYLKASYKFQLNVISPEGCKKTIKIVPGGIPPTDSVFVYRRPDNGIVTNPPTPAGTTPIFCYNNSSLNVFKPEYKWTDKNITYHWVYTIKPNLLGADSVIVPNKKSPADSILYLADSLHVGLQHATLFTTIDGVPGCNSDTVLTPFEIRGVRGSFALNKSLICLGEELRFDTLKVRDAESWKIVWGDNSADSLNTNPVKHTYQSGTSNGQYTVAVKFYNGACTETKTQTITVENVIATFNRNGEVVVPQLTDTTHCLGVTDNLTNNSSVVPNGAILTYTWLYGNGGSATTTNSSVEYTTPGTYEVKLIANDLAKGCSDTITKKIIVHPSPDANFTVNDTCFDDVTGKTRPINLNATGGGTGATYNWYVYNDNNTTNAVDSIKNAVNDSTGVIELTGINTSHTYFLEVTNQYGCKDTISKTAQVFFKPAGITVNDTILIGETDTLVANAIPVDKYNYTWTPSTDLNCATCPTVISSTLEDITYTLNYADKAGCFTVSNIYNIKVDPLTTMDVPTAFTPNGDGTNDIVYVDGRGIKQLNYFKIYNRWGELVFETANIKEGWDGTFKGQKQPIETYVWQAEVQTWAKDTTKNTIFKKGIVKLFR